MKVSVIIPTRNRLDSLCRLLISLAGQSYPLHEVIVIDASDSPVDPVMLRSQWPALNIRYLTSQPSVCAQRNLGIQQASGSHIFLCDDDMEVPREYVGRLAQYLSEHPEVGAVSGVVIDPSDFWRDGSFLSPIGTIALLWRFLFQLSVFADLGKNRTGFWHPTRLLVRRFYRWRNNTWSLAGWPLLTEVQGEIVRTAIYGLGAAIVRRDWLIASPYDEILDSHGIGDNYGVCLGFPQLLPIHVLSQAKVIHHHSQTNRLERNLTYYRRVLALHYFMTKDYRFSPMNRLMLLWSLIGNLLFHLLRRDSAAAKTSVKLLWRLAKRQNPYLTAFKSHRTPCEPTP